jgi:hypothetical protein
VWDAVSTRPNNFPSVENPPNFSREREGVMFDDGTVGVLSDQTLAKIARDSGLPDYQAGLRLLREHDLMVYERGRSKATRRIIRTLGNTDNVRMYVFKPLEEIDK